jgi:peptidyl-prolyl cis-trans isomerase C
MSCSSQDHNYEKASDISFPTILINGDSISAESIANEMQYHPADSADQALLESAQSLVIKHLLTDEAQRSGLLEQCNGDEELAVSELLGQQAIPVEASDDECEQYYASNKERFRTAPFIAVRHILLSAAPDDFDARDKAKQNTESLIKQLADSPAQFSEFAKIHSDCPSKDNGGDLGQLSRGQTTAEFERQVFPLPEGLCEHPIESRYGFHVIDVQKKIEGKPTSVVLIKNC